MPLSSGGDLGVARASTALREWGWPIPDEVVVFASDGGGDPFGPTVTGTIVDPYTALLTVEGVSRIASLH